MSRPWSFVSPQLLAMCDLWASSHWPHGYGCHLIHVAGVPHWHETWVPGPHPEDAEKCEHLSCWVRVRKA